ncbi:MAG: hypothetical protein AAF368_03575 [Planctomycetota bacterium]
MNRLRALCLALWSLPLCASSVHADLRDGIGTTVCDLGDVDRDGEDDVGVLVRARGLLIGRFAEDFAVLERAPLAPHLAVLSGATGELLRLFPAYEEAGTYTSLVCGIGDLTGDRRAEVVVSGGGTVRCFSALTAELLWEAGKGLERKRFGWNLLRVPDANEDGADDLVAFCGPTRLRGQDEALHLLSGADGSILRTLSGKLPGEGEKAALGLFTHLELPGGGSTKRNLAPCRPLTLLRDASGLEKNAVSFIVRWPSQRRSNPEIFERWTLDLKDFGLQQEGIVPALPWGLCCLGSVNGDDFADFVTTSRSEWLRVNRGQNGVQLFERTFEGGQTNGEGSEVSSLRDVDGDGVCEILMSANEEVADCDGGSARVISGARGTELWRLDFQGKNGPALGPCGAGVDAVGLPARKARTHDDVVCHMPRLREVRRLDGRNGAVIWRFAYDVDGGGVVQARPDAELSGRLIAASR